MTRLTTALALASVLVLAGCGSGGRRSTITLGPTDMWLGHLPTAGSTNTTLGLRNLATDALVAAVTAYRPDGTAYPPGTVMETVPPGGELRQPLGRYTGGAALAGGWLHVTQASGLLKVYLERRTGSASADAVPAGAWRATAVETSLTRWTTGYQIVNHSPGAPITFLMTEYDAFGAVLGAPKATPAPVAMNGTHLETPSPGARRVRVERMGGPVVGDLFGVSQIEDSVVQIETRYLNPGDTSLMQLGADLDISFGEDSAGNIHDFALLFSNASASSRSVLVNAIWTASGTVLLGTPTLLVLDGRSTKLFATTTAQSDGLELGETSFLEPLFGDVGSATGLTRLHVSLTVPREVDASFRQYDSVFDAWGRVIPLRKTTNDVCVAGVEIQTTPFGGIRNTITLANATAGAVDVFVRGFTPGGTEYILPNLTVAAFSVLEWTPDGLVFREVPTDLTGPPVPYMTFRLSSVGTLGIDATRRRVDVAERILYVQSIVVRDLRFE